MQKELRNQIIRTAVITTPVIALLTTIPLFITKRSNEVNFFVIWFVYISITTFAWWLNIELIKRIKKSWVNTWIRVVLSSIIMICSGTLLLILSPFKISIGYLSQQQITMIRLINNFSINFIIFILLDLIFTKDTQLRLNKENAELKFANLDAEYKLLKDQVNPHFLFNVLNIAKSLIKTKPAEAEQYIMQLSEFLRLSVNTHQKSNSVTNELELASKFVELQQLRFINALFFSADVNAEISSLHIPFFTLVSLIENAIKHNRADEKNPLHISVYTQSEWLLIKNNLNPKFVMASSRTGLANINQRSILLSGNAIEIVNNEREFLVKIKPVAL